MSTESSSSEEGKPACYVTLPNFPEVAAGDVLSMATPGPKADHQRVRSRLLATLRAVELAKRSTPLERMREAVLHADSYRRIEVVMMDARYALSRVEWFILLGREWSGIDNIVRWRGMLRHILRRASRAELDAMMKPAEREALARLPERITVYRGCYDFNRPGLSWTLDRAQAERFPSLLRYRHEDKQPILRSGTVVRERVVLKLDRNEQEVIAANVWGITERPIELVPPRLVVDNARPPKVSS